MTCVQIAYHDYQTDEQGWVDTILSVPVNGTVRINTMDWLGQSEYTNTIVFWPALSSAIAKVQKSIRPILVRLRVFNYQAQNLQVEIVVICLPAMELDLWFFWEKNNFLAIKGGASKTCDSEGYCGTLGVHDYWNRTIPSVPQLYQCTLLIFYLQ